MAVIDVAGYVADLKDHSVDHGFHVHDERHFVETYSLRQVWEVERSAAPVFGVELHFPDLAERVGLDEVPLVVHVESVVDGMILQVGDVPRDVNGSHSWESLMGVGGQPPQMGRGDNGR